jgi:two-component system phosphate regulon sensor histidine kinase PhoR
MLLLPADAVGKPTLEAVRNGELKDLLDRARTAGRATGEIELSGIKPRRLLIHAAGITDKPGRLLSVFVDVTDLRRLESLRRDFVANVSHELRTPVTAVRSAAETLRGAAANDPVAAAQFVEIIERNAERLQRLVEDLLDLSRIESRAYRLNLEDVPAESVARHALSLFHERAEKKRLFLRTAFPAGLPALRADRRALEQVVINLIDNAIKYCQEGTGITIGAEPVPPGTALPDVADPARPHLRIFVHDNGPGIEQQHLSRLFERFYRVDTGRSRELGGTGLGLSIVKHLVEAMGGSVSVTSEVGHGSTFSCLLPIWLPDVDERSGRP